jgi:hypothetical protein
MSVSECIHTTAWMVRFFKGGKRDGTTKRRKNVSINLDFLDAIRVRLKDSFFFEAGSR